MSVPWYLMAKGKGGGGYKTASGPIVSISDAVAAPLRSLLVNIDPVQEGTGDPSPDNVRPISGWSAVNVWVKHTYDPTANPTATLQLGQTVYGGTLDVTNGVLTVAWINVTINTITNWATKSPGIFTAGLWNRRFQRNLYPVISSAYKTYKGANSTSDNISNLVQNNGDALYVNAGSNTIYIADSRYTNHSDFLVAMGDQQLCYELADQITIPLTPQEISTLGGQNNVWADTGDVTVEYLSAGGANPDLMKLAVAFMGRK